MADNQVNDYTCVVCFKHVTYYSIGECDHPVCHECSTRMRVLCSQNECPICRKDLVKVIFTENVEPFSKLRCFEYPDHLFDRMYHIVFYTEKIKQAYKQLLEHRCKLCTEEPNFRNFNQLSDHMRKIHQQFYCDLCVLNLKIFTFERKCYSRQQLAHHRRKGDPDDTSHRGHPLCQFCETRYMDMDELYRHLRKDHLFCHLCDADGKNLYYDSYFNLAQHFRTDHYLCEEGECADNQLTSVFRTSIDLKAHKALVHGKNLGKAASRQARVLSLEFNVASPNNSRASVRLENAPTDQDIFDGSLNAPTPAPARPVNWSANDFPSLAGTGPPLPLPGPSGSKKPTGTNRLARTEENFPALDKSSTVKVKINNTTKVPASAVLRSNSKPSVTIPLQAQPATARDFKLTQPGVSKGTPSTNKMHNMIFEDFPSLPSSLQYDNYPSLGSASMQPSKIALVNREPMKTDIKTRTNCNQPLDLEEAFPALTPSVPPPFPPKWITKSKEKPVKKKPEPAPAPKLPQSSLNTIADFPVLQSKDKNKKQKANNVQPLNNESTALNNITNTSKKNNKKEKKKNCINYEIENQTKLMNDQSSEINLRNDSIPNIGIYSPPPNFKKRNADLVQNLIDVMGSDEKMERFKQESRAFREDSITAFDFLERCIDSIGEENVSKVLPELIALLPDIQKQKELAKYCNVALVTCEYCGQLLTIADQKAHEATHWPAL